MIVPGRVGGGFIAIIFVTSGIDAAYAAVFTQRRTRHRRRVNAPEAGSPARVFDSRLSCLPDPAHGSGRPDRGVARARVFLRRDT
ncbi:hypothetical protein WS93_34465 [Burkholderia cepacia]|nr:hypothetical protein WS93_34465 [Burkholderia cepacia]